MPVFRKIRKKLKNFRHYQYRKKLVKENCRRYLFPLCICILSLGGILVIIYLFYHLFGLLYLPLNHGTDLSLV